MVALQKIGLSSAHKKKKKKDEIFFGPLDMRLRHLKVPTPLISWLKLINFLHRKETKKERWGTLNTNP